VLPLSLAGQGYTYETVNHSVEYVTADGVHMNQTENLWRDANRKLNAMNGVQHTYLPSNLDEWVWRHKHLLEWPICKKNVINVYICLRCVFEPFSLCGTSKLRWF